MFEIKTQVVEWNNKLYVIKRSFKDTGELPPLLMKQAKRRYQADVVARKDGFYFFLEEVKEPEILEEIIYINNNKSKNKKQKTINDGGN